MARKETGNYCFPKGVAKLMSKITQRTQYESSMMAIVFILAGLVFMTIYIPFFTEASLLMKIGIVVNTIAGIGFLGSYLITTYQQYRSYLMVMGVIKDEETN